MPKVEKDADVIDDYENVGLNDTDMDSLLSGEEESEQTAESPSEKPESDPTEGQKDEEDSEKDTEEGDEPPADDTKKYKFGEEEYTEEGILEALEIAKNMKDFRAKTQQNSMLNADNRKKLEPVIKLINSMRDNGEALEDIREVIAEKLGEETLGIFDDAIKFDSKEYTHPDSDKVKDVKKENEELKSQIKLREIVEEFRVENKLKVSEGKSIEKFIMEKHTKEGIAFSPEEAYKIMNFDKVKKKADEKSVPADIVVPDKNKGAEKIKEKEKAVTSYDDIKITDDDGIFTPD